MSVFLRWRNEEILREGLTDPGDMVWNISKVQLILLIIFNSLALYPLVLNLWFYQDFKILLFISENFPMDEYVDYSVSIDDNDNVCDNSCPIAATGIQNNFIPNKMIL